MGTGAIIDQIEPHATTDSSGSDDEVVIFAPSLRALPPGDPFVMATLPILDWNAELFRAIDNVTSVGNHCYAAILMIDPFTLWEDLADLLLGDGGEAGAVVDPGGDGPQPVRLGRPGRGLAVGGRCAHPAHPRSQ